MAPVSTYINPISSAIAFAIVLFPAPAGPSIAIEHIVGLSSYMYYNIGKITSSEVTSLISCSDYVHAFKTSTLARATDYNLDFFGILRGVSMDDYYTYQNCAQASWEGSW